MRRIVLILAAILGTGLFCGNASARHLWLPTVDNPFCAITTYLLPELREQAMSTIDENGQPVITPKARAYFDALPGRAHERIEQAVSQQLKLDAAAQQTEQLLETVWGVGEILGRTILLETGPVGRFPQVGDYSSYCRAVTSQCWSNGRQKGENNAKCGNRYLAWAYVEAANYAARYYGSAQRFVERKTAQVNRALAIKALANKLCRASYWVMKEQVKFEPTRLFGS